MLKSYQPTLHFTPLVTRPVHSRVISTPRGSYSPVAISAHRANRTHCRLCPIRYSFSPESSEAFEDEAPRPRTQHRNNVLRLRGEKHNISLKILHRAGLETARQAAILAKCHALTTAPCPSLIRSVYLAGIRMYKQQSVITCTPIPGNGRCCTNAGSMLAHRRRCIELTGISVMICRLHQTLIAI